MRRARAYLCVAVVALTAPLVGCGPLPPGRTCVPELSVTPEDPRPGRIVTVETTHACPVDLPEGARWEVRIQPADERIPLARAFVRPHADGSFAVSITVPPTIAPGPAIAHISNYGEYAKCAEGASCAAASVTFDVRH
ncbi:hypothetical protein ACTU3I_17295 [Microbacterium sp. RD1]|uniref:hypothetical protein n=1 Tax=Microbacterium sp. RD1 TaxID=3457313 RepID=UPI003FA5FFBC